MEHVAFQSEYSTVTHTHTHTSHTPHTHTPHTPHTHTHTHTHHTHTYTHIHTHTHCTRHNSYSETSIIRPSYEVQSSYQSMLRVTL